MLRPGYAVAAPDDRGVKPRVFTIVEMSVLRYSRTLTVGNVRTPSACRTCRTGGRDCFSEGWWLNGLPYSESASEYYHWHVEIIPKLTKVAGFEWPTGFYVNPTAPEEAAQILRDARL